MTNGVIPGTSTCTPTGSSASCSVGRGSTTSARDDAAVNRLPSRRPAAPNTAAATASPPRTRPEWRRKARRSTPSMATRSAGAAARARNDCVDQPERTDARRGAEHAGDDDVPRNGSAPARRRPGADDTEQPDTDDPDDESVAQGDETDRCGVDGEEHPDADEQGRLVVGPEGVDGEVLDERRRTVDDPVADVEHRGAPRPVQPGQQLGDPERDRRGDEPGEHGDETGRAGCGGRRVRLGLEIEQVDATVAWVRGVHAARSAPPWWQMGTASSA